MSWNFDDDVVRIPRSILRKVAAVAEPPGDVATEWPRVRVVLMRVLGLFPEARDAFVKAIQEAFETRLEPVPQWAT